MGPCVLHCPGNSILHPPMYLAVHRGRHDGIPGGRLYRQGGGQHGRQADSAAQELLRAHTQQVQQVRLLLLLL